MLEVRGLAKSYGERVAVQDVNFTAESGRTLGLLGPNGAGKSTVVNIVAGLLRPDRGEVRIHGRVIESDTSAVKLLVGFVPQDLALYEELSALDNLRLFGALYGLRGAELAARADAALAVARLADRARDKVESFSGGMKRRLNIAAALLHEPQILLLDEPTVGVDPQSRNAIFDTLGELKAKGLTLVYTTHYMEEAERLCDRVVIIDQGRVLADDTLAGLYGRLPVACVLQVNLAESPRRELLEPLLCALPSVARIEWRDGGFAAGLADLAAGTAQLLACLQQVGATVRHLEADRPTLESVFLELTGRSLRDA
jgi:ABC-2 type transport system ATP-binding protein